MLDDLPKDFKKHAKKAAKQGFRWTKTKHGYRGEAPDGENHVTVHKTPSPSSLKHFVSDLRKYGYRP